MADTNKHFPDKHEKGMTRPHAGVDAKNLHAETRDKGMSQPQGMVGANKNLQAETSRKEMTRPRGRSIWSPFHSLQRDVDRMFEDFGRGWGLPSPRRWFGGLEDYGWNMSAVDVAEKDGVYEITAELPGVDENNIELSVANGVLTIRGEKSDEKEEYRKEYRLSERRFGSFQRSFALPDDADADKIEATFRKGVLTVSLPKRPRSDNG